MDHAESYGKEQLMGADISNKNENMDQCSCSLKSETVCSV